MKINELNGRVFKKALSARNCRYRYHNRNNTGGNFAFEIHGAIGRDFELSGAHGITGEIGYLRIGEIFSVGSTLDKYHYETVERLIALIFSICGDVKEE